VILFLGFAIYDSKAAGSTANSVTALAKPVAFYREKNTGIVWRYRCFSGYLVL